MYSVIDYRAASDVSSRRTRLWLKLNCDAAAEFRFPPVSTVGSIGRVATVGFVVSEGLSEGSVTVGTVGSELVGGCVVAGGSGVRVG